MCTRIMWYNCFVTIWVFPLRHMMPYVRETDTRLSLFPVKMQSVTCQQLTPSLQLTLTWFVTLPALTYSYCFS